jgi:hypothetical protein
MDFSTVFDIRFVIPFPSSCICRSRNIGKCISSGGGDRIYCVAASGRRGRHGPSACPAVGGGNRADVKWDGAGSWVSLERAPETSAVPGTASFGEKDLVEGEKDAKLFSR